MVIDRWPTNVFTSEAGNIELSSVTGYVDLEVRLTGGTPFLNERYIPDASGRVTIFGIGDIAFNFIHLPEISAHLQQLTSGYETLMVKLAEKDGTPNESACHFYVSAINSDGQLIPADLNTMPISLVNEKRTGIGRKENISFKGDGGIRIYAVHKSSTGDKGITIGNYASPPFGYLGIFNYDISPALIATAAGCAEKDLIYYNVYKDESAVIKYIMSEREYPHLRTFAFINAFYGQETFHTLEAGNAETKWNRNIGSIAGINRQFRPITKKTFTVNTGWLKRKEIPVLEDLLSSQRVALWENGAFVAVVIDADSIKITDEREELIAVEFSYRYADDRYLRHKYVKRPKLGVFDATFDATFN